MKETEPSYTIPTNLLNKLTQEYGKDFLIKLQEKNNCIMSLDLFNKISKDQPTFYTQELENKYGEGIIEIYKDYGDKFKLFICNNWGVPH